VFFRNKTSGPGTALVRSILRKAPTTLHLDLSLMHPEHVPVKLTCQAANEKDIERCCKNISVNLSLLYWFGCMNLRKSRGTFQFLVQTLEELIKFQTVCKTICPYPDNVTDFCDFPGWLQKMDMPWSSLHTIWNSIDER
jgi:hypothetical protein